MIPFDVSCLLLVIEIFSCQSGCHACFVLNDKELIYLHQSSASALVLCAGRRRPNMTITCQGCPLSPLCFSQSLALQKTPTEIKLQHKQTPMLVLPRLPSCYVVSPLFLVFCAARVWLRFELLYMQWKHICLWHYIWFLVLVEKRHKRVRRCADVKQIRKIWRYW